MAWACTAGASRVVSSPIVPGKTRSKGCSGRNRERHPRPVRRVELGQDVPTARIRFGEKSHFCVLGIAKAG
jgi:hypothetical protein